MTSINSTTIKIKRDPAATWTANNKTLSLGEPGIESDTHKMKIGDGSTPWNDLPYTSDGNYVSFQTKRDTAANLASNNPIIEVGEIGLETDTRKTKYGNGSSNWNDLPYSTCPVDGSEVPVKIARDTDANLTSSNPVVGAGEFMYNTTTGGLVCGDGESNWSGLPDIRKQFQNVITVAKTGKKGAADFICSDSQWGGEDSACIQAALNKILEMGGGILHINKGHYICNFQLLYTSSNLIIEGDGESTLLDFSAAAPGLFCIYIHGGILETNTTLATDASISDLAVSVTPGTGSMFSPGDWIRIRSDALFYNNYAGEKSGEIQQIKYITDDTLTLNEALFDKYLVSDTATVDKLNMLENIYIKNLKMVATNSNNNLGIVITQAHNIKIENLSSEDLADRFIYLDDVVSSNVTGCVIKRSNRDGLGYGLAVCHCSRDITATMNKFYDCRHGIMCGGGGIILYGIQYNQVYTNNIQSYSVRGQGMFGMHPTYNGLTVSNNTVEYDGLGYFSGLNNLITSNSCFHTSTNSAGIRIDSSATISNNRIYSIKNIMGIKIAPADNTVDTNIQILNNYISTVGGYGIYTETGFKNVTIKNNTIYANYMCIKLRDTASPGTSSTNLVVTNNAMHMGANATGDVDGIILAPTNEYSHVEITNNLFDLNGCAIEIIPASTMSNIIVENNTLNNSTFGVYAYSFTDLSIKNNKFNNITNIAAYIKNIGSPTKYTISNNKFNSCTHTITDEVLASDRKIYANDGYTTENSGTATITATTTSVTVTHGLSKTPTKVQVFPTSNLLGKSYWPSAYGATTFVINISEADATNPMTFEWSAEV